MGRNSGVLDFQQWKILFVYHKQQPSREATIILKSLEGPQWEKQLRGVDCSLSQDNKTYIFSSGDTIGIGILGTDKIEYLTGIENYSVRKYGAAKDWLVYRKNASTTDLFIKDLQTGKGQCHPLVKDYWFSKNGERLFLYKQQPSDSTTKQTVECVDLRSGNSRKIWQGQMLRRPPAGHRRKPRNFRWKDRIFNYPSIIAYRYDQNTIQSVQIKSPDTQNSKFNLSGVESISDDGAIVYFRWQPIGDTTKPDGVPVDIWSYKDAKLQSQQLQESKETLNYLAAINLRESITIPIEDRLHRIQSSQSSNSKYAIIQTVANESAEGEWNWNDNGKTTLSLLSLKDGSCQTIDPRLTNLKIAPPICRFSPGNRYIVYYDPLDKNYFSYNIGTRKLCNLTKAITTTWTTYENNDIPAAAYLPIGIAGFLRDDSAVLLYDQHDIYSISLDGSHTVQNLTNGYGKKQNLVFRVSFGHGSIMDPSKQVILSSFNINNKDDGFFKLQPGSHKDPKQLSMQPFILTGTETGVYQEPIRARDTSLYLVRRMSASEPANWLLTSDFTHYTALTNVHPEKAYNWLSTELITFRTLAGVQSQGILYKPENFDPTKKYPLLITYYERASQSLHAFIYPEPTAGPLEIPFYVSNGYLVFVPDIHFQIGSPGKSSYNTVVAAASLLCKRPYINKSKMGIQGHSFGGFQTNYIVTHSHIFAAAMSSSGMSDFVSIYGSIVRGGHSRQLQYELYRDRMGATLWDIPQKYIENSPVMRADKVTTPILLMANKEDGDVPYTQGVEFFTALRRLGKKRGCFNMTAPAILQTAGALTISVVVHFNSSTTT
ncbi:alpha/beta hydrolase family protein [Puia sp. P3]|uniref:alpha/beta hydrolase family protein n=1 Tax=Puia sp. P3 TaxID=3423952 RepID=UPI003D67B7A8